MPKGADIPCQRTLAHLRKEYEFAAVEKVEYWNHFAKKRHDLFGFADVIAVGWQIGFALYQVTTRGQMSARRGKILGKPQKSDKKPEKYADYRLSCLQSWFDAGGRVFVHGWEQVNGKGSLWQLTEWEVTQRELWERMETGEIPRRKG